MIETEDLTYEQLCELITKEVIKALAEAENKNKENGKTETRPLALLIGDKSGLPGFAVDKYSFADISDYKGDISGFDCVFVTQLSLTELADAAAGKDNRPSVCAISNAFLTSKKVYIMESGLPHRKYRETASRRFYALLEGYVNNLVSYGAELIREQWHGKNLDRNAIEDNTVDRVITEKAAVSLRDKAADGVVYLRRGTVITPSAKDIFNHSQIKVKFTD